MSHLITRRLTPDDLSALLHVERDLALAGVGMVLDPDEQSAEKTTARLEEFCSAAPDQKIMLGVFSGEVLAGVADLSRIPLRRINHVAILTMGVHPDHQGRGVGRRLMDGLLSWADRVGVIRVELYVRADNLRAQSLYQSSGFQLEGVRRSFIIDPDGTVVDDHIMARIHPG